MQEKRNMRWVMKDADETRSQALAEELGVPVAVGRLLVQRNKVTVEEAQRFLYPDKHAFYDPFIMKDMGKAVERIRRAIKEREHIMVYGDYDADGATATSMLYLALKELGAHVEYYIPDRFAEGYGLNEAAIRMAKDQGFSLVITVDNGISANDEVRIASEIGLDLIITDHHTPPEQLPEAYAILNPKQPGCPYPDKMLAGVGVVFKLVHALFDRVPEEYFELAAIGTVADLAPLDDENRLLTVFGLEQLNQHPRAGIQALIDVSGLAGRKLTAGHIGFSLGPRINAAGRLDSATNAVELLITEDPLRAKELALFLEEQNRERREIGDVIFEEAVQEVEAHPEWLEARILVLASGHWNAGVIGIVASRLVERYYRPVLMISVTDGMGKGSARSIQGFHLYEALHACEDLLEHYGGHKMAAGFSVREEKIPLLRNRLQALAQEWLTEEDLIPQLSIDAQINLPDIDISLVEQIAALGPFGFGNPSPRFLMQALDLRGYRAVGKEQEHLQMTLGQGVAQIGCVAFQRGTEVEQVKECSQLDVVGELAINEWNGQKRLQLIVHDWRPSSVQVFDLRDRKDRVQWVEQMQRKRPLLLACFSEAAYHEAKRTFCLYPWEEQVPSLIVRVNENGTIEGAPEGHPADVVVYDLPYSLEQFQAFVSHLHNGVRLYMLQGEKEYQQALREANDWIPDRDAFAHVFRTLKRLEKATKEELLSAIHRTYAEHLEWMMQVFIELGFAYNHKNTYYVVKDAEKRSLTEAKSYRERLIRTERRKRVIEVIGHASREEMLAWLQEFCLRYREDFVS
ncbi:single-stranded-DNA-specific exonuclease RecJ [Collibacillus ludicampi]|uniref:Single-stranded-DNA-specific exonuclease RecJ n=2 Tax=Collibacillus ludicampi TaxID=2771369 RepID=A0AAV4LHP5_9BACL|nr:single-stranded-DNA-specific exonuclease RecJ [Collibacillus ludicampi]